jgi:hypothetical protein
MMEKELEAREALESEKSSLCLDASLRTFAFFSWVISGRGEVCPEGFLGSDTDSSGVWEVS